jgi:hypothetical protein
VLDSTFSVLVVPFCIFLLGFAVLVVPFAVSRFGWVVFSLAVKGLGCE